MAGKVQAVEQPKKMAPVVDLMAALKESLAQTKKLPRQKNSPRCLQANRKQDAEEAEENPGFRVSEFQGRSCTARFSH